MVERVEHFESELQALTLGEIPVFLNGHVPIEELGPMKILEEPGSITECKAGRLRKCGWINPVVDRLIRWDWIHSRHDVGALVETETDVIRGWLDRKRQS